MIQRPVQRPAAHIGLGRRHFLLRSSETLGALCSSVALRQVAASMLGACGAVGSQRAQAVEPATIVTVAVAIAGSIFNAIQRHNASDGGVGAMQTASLGYHRATLEGLSSVMSAVNNLQGKMAALSRQVASLPRETDEHQTRTMLDAMVRGYATVLGSHAQGDYKSWRMKNQNDLNIIWEGLFIAVHKVGTGVFNQPLTATAFVTAQNAYLAVGVALGKDMRELARGCIERYDMLSAVDRPGSVRARLDVLYSQHRAVAASLEKMGVSPSPASAGLNKNVLLASVGIQDYSPAYEERVGFPRRPFPQADLYGDGTSLRRFPERVGALECFHHEVRVKSSTSFATQDIQPARNLVVYTADEQVVTRTVPSASPTSPTFRYVALTPEARRQLALQPQHLSPALERKAQLIAALDQYNNTSADILIHELALDLLARSATSIHHRFLEKAA